MSDNAGTSQSIKSEYTNGAYDWSKLGSTVASAMYGLHIFSTDNGVACGFNGRIEKYTNGAGATIASGVTTILHDVTCAGTTLCVVAGAQSTILVSTDGASSFSKATVSTTGLSLQSASCPSTTTCYVVGAGYVFKTTDAGSAWSSQQVAGCVGQQGVSCPTTTTCYSAGVEGGVCKTTDGSTWTALTSPDTSATFYSTSFADENAGFVCGSGGKIYYTADGGSSWTLVNENPTAVNLYSIEYHSTKGAVVAVGDDGTILGSQTGTTAGSWTLQSYGSGSGAALSEAQSVNIATGSAKLRAVSIYAAAA